MSKSSSVSDINGLSVWGQIEWFEIGEGVDMEDGSGTSWVTGKDEMGNLFCAIGEIEEGIIEDIDESTLEMETL